MKSIHHLENLPYADLSEDKAVVWNGLTFLETIEAETEVKLMPINNEISSNKNASPRRATAFIKKIVSIPSEVFFRLLAHASTTSNTTMQELLGLIVNFNSKFRIVFQPGDKFTNLINIPKTLAKGEVMPVDLDLLSLASEGDITVELLKGSDRSVVVTDDVTPDASQKGSTTLTVPAGTTETKMIYRETQVVIKSGKFGATEDIVHTFESEITITA